MALRRREGNTAVKSTESVNLIYEEKIYSALFEMKSKYTFDILK